MKQTFQSQIKVLDVAATVVDVQLLCFAFFLLLKTTYERALDDLVLNGQMDGTALW